jgi:hypothetical protein
MTDAVDQALPTALNVLTVLTKADVAAMIPEPGVGSRDAQDPRDGDLHARLTAILVNDINRVQQDVVGAVTQQVRHEQGRFDRGNPCTCEGGHRHHTHNHLHVDRD